MSFSPLRSTVFIAFALVLASAPLASTAARRVPHLATTYTVANCNGTGTGSLREAAGLAVAGDTIDLTHLTCASIFMTTSDGGQLTVSDVLIRGPGQDKLAIYGNDTNRVFYHLGTTAGAMLTIDGVTVAGGTAAGDVNQDYGGGCLYSNGNVTLRNATVRSCHFATTVTTTSLPIVAGGGLLVAGILKLENSLVSGNTVVVVGPNGASGGTGGGLAATTISLTNSVVSGNWAAGDGGGVSTYTKTSGNGQSRLTLDHSTLQGNFAGRSGGGFYANTNVYDKSTEVTITDSTLSDNSAFLNGGGFYADSSHVLMFGTTVSGNDANGSGGGYYVYSCLFFCGGAQPPPYSHLSMVNSTVSGNSAVGGTGGAYVIGLFYVDNSTIVRNTSDKPGGLGVGAYLSAQANGVLNNSLIAFNTSSDGLGVDAKYDPGTSSPIAGGNNFILTGGLTDMPNAVHGCPRIYPLGAYGGTTQTHALAADSPAIDKAGDTDEPTDQRGLRRVVGAAADVGAFERQRTRTPLHLKMIDSGFARCTMSP